MNRYSPRMRAPMKLLLRVYVMNNLAVHSLRDASFAVQEYVVLHLLLAH